MLKTHSTSAVVNSKLKVAPLFNRLDSPPNAPPKLSIDESALRRRQQLIIMASHRISQAPEEQRKQRPPLSGFFPLGYKDAAYQWWTSCTPAEAERAVLRYMPHLKEAMARQSSPAAGSPASSASSTSSATPERESDPYGNRVWRSTSVQLSGKNRALNEFSVERVGETVDETLVMLHGYGAGLGFFYKNFEGLTRQPGWKLYALDMLGMGNSSRPSFKITAKDQAGKIAEAESWFIDALEEWRKIRNIDKFTLLGHSLGGYLAVSYALKYPGHLNKLILASPVGIPEDPYAVDAAMPEPGESTLASEFTQDQQEATTPHASANGDSNSLNARNKTAAGATAAPKRPIPGWLVWLWDANVSPFSIVRMTGPLGPRFVSGWTSRRFNHLPEDESKILHEYSYGLFRQRGSGEYALPYLLAPGAYARSPVINRIQEVGRQVVRPATATTPEVRETGFPIVMMYGENDWMDVAGGYAAEEKIKQRCVKALMENTEEQRERENGSAKVIIIPRAGHHLYLDNADYFDEIIRKEMKETMEWGKKMRALDSQNGKI